MQETLSQAFKSLFALLHLSVLKCEKSSIAWYGSGTYTEVQVTIPVDRDDVIVAVQIR